MPELIDRSKVLEYLTPRIKTETPYGEGYNRALEDAAELVTLMQTIEAEPADCFMEELADLTGAKGEWKDDD